MSIISAERITSIESVVSAAESVDWIYLTGNPTTDSNALHHSVVRGGRSRSKKSLRA